MRSGIVFISGMKALRIDAARHRRALRQRDADIRHLMAERFAGSDDVRTGFAKQPTCCPVITRYTRCMTRSHQRDRIRKREIRECHQPGIS
ncbi:hypothetical protein D3C72_2092320 [compost metagenome]